MKRALELVTEKSPPGDLELEQAVVGAAVLEDKAARLIAAELQADDFLPGAYRLVFTRICELVTAGRGVDFHTLRRALTDAGEFEEVGRERLALIMESGASAMLVPEYVERLREYSDKRRLIALGTQLVEGGYNGASTAGLLDAMTIEAERMRQRRGGGFAPDWPLLDGADAWDFSRPEFAVEVLLPLEGVTWWGGMPKRYKSLLLQYVCLAIASDQEAVAQRFKILRRPKILYVAREDGGARLQERRDDILAAWGARPARGAIRFLVRPHFDLLDAKHIEWLRGLCVREGITLLALDTWTALSPAADPMAPEDQTRLAAVVVQLAEDIGGGVVVVDHSRKNRPAGQPLSSADIFGPLQKWAAAEHIVMLEVSGDQRRIEVFVEGKDGETKRFFLSVSPRGSNAEKFAYAGTAEEIADAQRAVGHGNRESVFKILAAAPDSLSTADVALRLKATGAKLSEATIQKHLKGLVGADRVKKTGEARATRYFALRISDAPSSEIPEDTR